MKIKLNHPVIANHKRCITNSPTPRWQSPSKFKSKGYHHMQHHHCYHTSSSCSSDGYEGNGDTPFRNTLSRRINDYPILKELYKPSGTRIYDKTMKIDTHVELVYVLLNFRGVNRLREVKVIHSHLKG